MPKKIFFLSFPFIFMLFFSFSCKSLGDAEKQVDEFLAAFQKGNYQEANQFMTIPMVF